MGNPILDNKFNDFVLNIFATANEMPAAYLIVYLSIHDVQCIRCGLLLLNITECIADYPYEKHIGQAFSFMV